MSESPPSSSSSSFFSSSTVSFFLHIFVVSPIISRWVRSSTLPRQRSLLYAVILLAVVSLSFELYHQQSLPPNLFQVMEISRSSSLSDLKKQYRTLSVRFHPDKNPSPDAATKFSLISSAYEILSDAESREKYEKFGVGEDQTAHQKKFNYTKAEFTWQQQMQMMAFYGMWAALTFIFTMGASNNNGRSWALSALVLIGIAEYQFKFGGLDGFTSLFPYWTPYEKVSLLHSLFPSILNGCRFIANVTYVDRDELIIRLVAELIEYNKEIVLQLEQMQMEMQTMTMQKKPNSSSSNVTPSTEHGPQQSLRLRRLQQHSFLQSQAIHQQQQQGKGGIPSWVMPIGLFVLFNYVLK